MRTTSPPAQKALSPVPRMVTTFTSLSAFHFYERRGGGRKEENRRGCESAAGWAVTRDTSQHTWASFAMLLTMSSVRALSACGRLRIIVRIGPRDAVSTWKTQRWNKDSVRAV
jgi:hypothetical protein